MAASGVTSRSRLRRLHERIALRGRETGITHLRLDRHERGGAVVEIEGRRLLNFGICSYLAMNTHPEVVEAAVRAVKEVGVNYSSSAAYSAVGLFRGLEDALSDMTDCQVVLAPTTTLAHMAALPVLVEPDDLVLVDSRAHASLHMTADLLRGEGHQVELLDHHDFVRLERELVSTEGRVWYVTDGVYSMGGEILPIEPLLRLFRTHANLHLYLDDAHGFSWTGRHGRGYVLERIGPDPRLVVAVSLSKSFGAAGGAVLVSDPGTADRIEMVGGPLTFGGPLQIAELAAGVASATVHLSAEHPERSARLLEQIDLVADTISRLGLPAVSRRRTPIWLVELGSTEQAAAVTAEMRHRGFYLNPAGYPAVPLGRAGVRFTHTLHHRDHEIVEMLEVLADVIGPTEKVVVNLESS